ncbi:GNAT family N-acetyltransferase [Herbiconiux sp. SYSU D00978]|uniref:GNAT family N-acetyltransferase n=1 Tax=Herbiconiux sp. SYSU D00978 TaxID=2812562 RepID=UPI001A97A8AE|nr:GNAT family N-acetyltransferase [Herbiconiux sp. SYSU D00978]
MTSIQRTRAFEVREAVPEDAAGLVDVRIRSWREAYLDIIPAWFLSSLDNQRAASVERWTGHIRRGENRFLAGLVEGRHVGFAIAGLPRDDDAPAPVELYALYTRAEMWGTGLGGALMAAAIGDGPAYLWTLEQNARAQAFYAKHGFAPDGDRKMLDGELSDIPEIRMVRPS